MLFIICLHVSNIKVTSGELINLVDFLPALVRQFFYTLFAFMYTSLLLKSVYSKMKEFVPMGSYFFSFGVEACTEGSKKHKTFLHTCLLNAYQFPLSYWYHRFPPLALTHVRVQSTTVLSTSFRRSVFFFLCFFFFCFFFFVCLFFFLFFFLFLQTFVTIKCKAICRNCYAQKVYSSISFLKNQMLSF